jgi:hypothetical protein
VSSSEENAKNAVASLQKLSALESETLAAEINLLGVLRDKLSPAARYGEKIQIKSRKVRYQGEAGPEQTAYLSAGFPFTETGKSIMALLVIDKYFHVEVDGEAGSGQYIGERLYLTLDRKWILAERVGAYSEASGSTNEWDATCRIITDRSLLDRYSIDVISDGLFAATNKLWEKSSPRMEALKKRSEKAQQVTGALTRMKSLTAPKEEIPATAGAKTEAKEPEDKTDKLKVHFSRSSGMG